MIGTSVMKEIKKIRPERVAIKYMWSFALNVTKTTLERLENGKQWFETRFECIDNTSVKCNINN